MKTIKTWTQEEDQFLRVNIQGSVKRNWVALAKKFNQEFKDKIKTAKQCRQRYINHSCLQTKLQAENDWRLEDYEKLISQFKNNGPKWTKISQFFEGKSQNSIKNKFYCCLRKFIRKINKILLKRKKKSYRKFSEKSLLRIIDANQSLEKLTPQLGQVAYIIKQKILNYSNPNLAEPSDELILELIDEINQFNLDSRSYRFYGTKQQKMQYSRISQQIKNSKGDDQTDQKLSIDSQNQSQIKNIKKDYLAQDFISQKLKNGDDDRILKWQDLPFEQYGIEYGLYGLKDSEIYNVRKEIQYNYEFIL